MALCDKREASLGTGNRLLDALLHKARGPSVKQEAA